MAKGRRFQFSLATMVAVVCLIGILLGIEVNRATKQLHAVKAIEARGGMVGYDFHKRNATEPAAPRWLRQFLGDDYFRTVYSVRFDNPELTNNDLAPLTDLPGLESVY